MKSIFLITVLFFSLSTFAQKPNAPRKAKPVFTPEQQAELQTKKLALTLELNEKQIKEVQAMELERAKARKANRELRVDRRRAGERPTDEELFAIKSERLDAQAEHQKKMKKILSDDQYATWKGMCNKNEKNKNNNRMSKQSDSNGSQKGKKSEKRNNSKRWN